MSNESNDLFEFGPYRLDAAKRLLTRSSEGIALAPKTFDLLLLLIGGQGRVLTKTKLMNALWPDTVVEEASLSYQVATLRKALGSAGEAWIETVPKHGYRFAAAIATIPREQEPANGNSSPMPTTAPSDLKSPRKVQPQQVLPWLVASAGVLMAVALALLYLRQVRNSVPTQGSARFFVSPPEKVMLSDRGLPAVSPNGEQLAFGGIDPDGTSRIWVRPIASLTSEPLPGTEGVHALFWSADSRSIGFFAGGKLKTVQLHGGTPRTLCDASDTLRPLGSWNRDGVILFNSFDRRGLFRVPMRGGPVAAVTTLDAARQDVLHLWPQFLPDGRHFFYTVESSIPENTGIYVGSLDGKKSKLVIRASSIANFAQSPSGAGYLLYLQGATLMAQRFNARALEPEGESFPIAEHVWLPPSPVPGFGAFSASGTGTLVYRSIPRASTELVWFDRQGKRLGTIGEPATYTNPALSPNEKKLAVARLEPAVGTRNLWLFDVDTGTPTRFTFDPADKTNPTWSPDGNQIVFSYFQKGTVDLYQKAVAGTSGAQPLLESNEQKLIENWSPDGRVILYEGGSDLWAFPLTGLRKPIRLFKRNGGTRAAVSPNGRWVAYQSNESGRDEVYVQSFSSSSGGRWQVSIGGGQEPYWRRDGQEIFYASGKKLMAVGVKTEGPVFEYGQPKPLFDVRMQEDDRRSRYQPSNNGQRFLVNVPLEATLTAPMTIVVNWGR